MNKKQFLKRCETIYDIGLADDETLKLMENWCDAVMRLQGGQFYYWVDFLKKESERTQNFSGGQTLANDNLGYGVIRLLAILTNPCQECGEDKNAWHTRAAFCEHKK